jgi:zinc transport system substrate-binding protein
MEMDQKIRNKGQAWKYLTALFLFCVPVLGLMREDLRPAAVLRGAERIRIVTTLFPLMEFAAAVGGDEAEVTLLLPPGAEIHAWRPRPSDIIRVAEADVFIYIGPALEPWVADLLRSIHNPDLAVINASQGREREEAGDHRHHEGEEIHGGMDPHIWLDLSFDGDLVRRIAARLSALRPQRSGYFEDNAESYCGKLAALDRRYEEGLADCRQRVFVLGGHAAFGHLARRYRLEQIALYGLSPDAEPTPRQMIEVIKIARDKGIRVIFFEVNVSSRMARVLADEIGAETRVLDPGASPSREDMAAGIGFLDIMEKNLENLRYGLLCR